MKIMMATLTNGKQVPKSSVVQIIMQLEEMAAAEGFMPLYELLQVCKDPAHKPFGMTGDVMNGFGVGPHC